MASAGREVGCPVLSVSLPATRFPDGKAAFWRLPAGSEGNRGRDDARRIPRGVFMDLRRPRREVLHAMIEATVEAANHPWYRPDEIFGIYAEMLHEWPRLRARGPRTEGLAQTLHAVTDTGGDEHPVAW